MSVPKWRFFSGSRRAWRSPTSHPKKCDNEPFLKTLQKTRFGRLVGKLQLQTVFLAGRALPYRRPRPEALPQCIVRRQTALSSHGEQLHRHTASIHASIHTLRHRRSLARVHCCCWRPADYIVTRLRTILSHGCGQHRHTLRTHIVTWCKTIEKKT